MTIAIDFDGVIHRYSQGWKDGAIYDPPIEGAIDSIKNLMQYDAVFIHTTRDPQQVADWLAEYDIPTKDSDDCECQDGDHSECHGTGIVFFWDNRDKVLVTQRKLPAYVYVDDRGLRFHNWHQTLNELYKRSIIPRIPVLKDKL